MKRGGDGYILVTVLGTMLLLSGLIAATSLVAQSSLRSARADDGTATLEALARSGLELAAFQVFARHAPFAEVNGRILHLSNGAVTAVFSDEAARVDINSADPVVLLGVLREAGLDETAASTLVSRTVSLRDAGDQGGPLTTAPDALAPGASATQAASPAKGSAHGTFHSVADFIVYSGLGREEALTLKSLLTASNPDGKVDVMTASRSVLMALPGMSDALADTILTERKVGTAAIERLKSALTAQAAYVKFEPGPCFGIAVAARTSVGRGLTRRGIIAASHSSATPFYTLVWN